MERRTDAAGGRGPRGLRVLRGSAAAAVAVVLAATAHTLSGGEPPPAWLVVAVTILAAPPCTFLVGRRRSLAGLAAAVAAAQLALHGAFAAVGAASPAAGMTPDGAHHHGALLLPALAALDPAATTMGAGHAFAAVATLAVLSWGESLLVTVARGIRRLLAPTATPALPRPLETRTVFLSRRGAASALLHVVTRRGPPTRLATAV